MKRAKASLLESSSRASEKKIIARKKRVATSYQRIISSAVLHLQLTFLLSLFSEKKSGRTNHFNLYKSFVQHVFFVDCWNIEFIGTICKFFFVKPHWGFFTILPVKSLKLSGSHEKRASSSSKPWNALQLKFQSDFKTRNYPFVGIRKMFVKPKLLRESLE